MDASTAGLIGVVTGGAVTLLANLIPTWQKRRLIRHANLSGEEGCHRDKLHEIYINCICSMGSKNSVRRAKWLNLLLVYHPELNQKGYTEFLDKFTRDDISVNDIVALALRDPRIQDVSM